jgi:glycosyltransferase involved in cell wall biosynthesis
LRGLIDKLAFHLRTVAEIRRSKPEAVLLHQTFQVHTVVFAKAMRLVPPGLPVVVDIRTLPVFDDSRAAMVRGARFMNACRLAARALGGLTVTSPMLGDALVSAGVPAESILGVWPSGADARATSDGSAIEPAVLQVVESLGRPRAVYLGALMPDRGLDALIEAASQSGFPLLFIGDGPMRDQLTKQASQSAAAKGIAFVGHVDHDTALGLLDLCDIGVSPLPPREYWAVSSPLKVAEYQSSGLAIAATDIEAHRYALNGYAAAAIAPDESPESLSAAMCSAAGMLEGREDRRESHNAPTWDQVAVCIEDALEKAVQQSRGRQYADTKPA